MKISDKQLMEKIHDIINTVDLGGVVRDIHIDSLAKHSYKVAFKIYGYKETTLIIYRDGDILQVMSLTGTIYVKDKDITKLTKELLND